MKVLILGVDGYIGWPLALHLKERGHLVKGVDDFSRRNSVRRIGSESLTPISDYSLRSEILGSRVINYSVDGEDHSYLIDILSDEPPDAIFHLAEQPSAPYSMMDAEHALYTQSRNVLGTLSLLWAMKEVCPNAHLIKIGTMGEYGTPNCSIPEGRIPTECPHVSIECDSDPSFSHSIPDCPMSGLLFPRTAGSFYHLSKVHDTHNIEFACRNWGLKSTDIMQGIVFGLNECKDKTKLTRFDYDECFGTVINRFCVQAITNEPLTVYGSGSQIRGFLPLQDSIQCLTIALENPPVSGDYRTWNQFERVYQVKSLANMVCTIANSLRLHPLYENILNPRKESENHYYKPTLETLYRLGYKPTSDIESELKKLISALLPYKYRVKKEAINPTIKWR